MRWCVARLQPLQCRARLVEQRVVTSEAVARDLTVHLEQGVDVRSIELTAGVPPHLHAAGVAEAVPNERGPVSGGYGALCVDAVIRLDPRTIDEPAFLECAIEHEACVLNDW